MAAVVAASARPEVARTIEEPDLPGSGTGRRSQADDLVGMATLRGELFSDRADEVYARVAAGDHHEVYAVRSGGFRRWLGALFFAAQGKAPSGEAWTAAIATIEAIGAHCGEVREVYLRVAPDGGAGIFIDVGDSKWTVIHLTVDGWRIARAADVYFRRSPGMLPLPVPVAGGSLGELREFVNLPSDDGWALLRAWMVAALCPSGPYPVLVLLGEQGSAKSTAARMVRALIDPSLPELRANPRDAHDLVIGARASWLLALDNVSRVPEWLSDCLCRLATGGGWATRQLYTDRDETLFDAKRPALLNGIEDFIRRGDLLDRTVALELPTIPDDRRRAEAALWAQFEAAKPRILGGLLDELAGGLRELPNVRLDRLPRMADFALLAVAAERGRGATPTFLRAYADVRAAAHEQALEVSIIGSPLRQLLVRKLPWTGTAAELLHDLEDLASESVRRSKYWPKTPRGLSNELRRLAPAIRALGYEIDLDRREPRTGRRLIALSESGRKEPSPPSRPSPDAHSRHEPGDGMGVSGDGGDGRGARGDGRLGTGDGGDGRLPLLSDGLPERICVACGDPLPPDRAEWCERCEGDVLGQPGEMVSVGGDGGDDLPF